MESEHAITIVCEGCGRPRRIVAWYDDGRGFRLPSLEPCSCRGHRDAQMDRGRERDPRPPLLFGERLAAGADDD